jgi:hypothetical protein
MCMKCGCSTPNDKIVAKPIVTQSTGAKTIVVPATNSTPGGYDGNNGY